VPGLGLGWPGGFVEAELGWTGRRSGLKAGLWFGWAGGGPGLECGLGWA
jgi:hypothetical protein